MHWFPCFNGRRALIAQRPISIGFSSNLSSSLYSGLSVRVLVSADNPQGGSTNSISSSRPYQLKRVCISQHLHLSQRHLRSAGNPLDTIEVSTPDQVKRSRKKHKMSQPPFEVADIIRAHGK